MAARPTEIKLHRRSKVLDVAFDDGQCFALPCELLRVFSPSAEVRGHGSGPGILVVGKEDVNIERIEPIGHYAVRLVFDDRHDSGIFTWDYLRELGESKDACWAEYLVRLADAGQARRE